MVELIFWTDKKENRTLASCLPIAQILKWVKKISSRLKIYKLTVQFLANVDIYYQSEQE